LSGWREHRREGAEGPVRNAPSNAAAPEHQTTQLFGAVESPNGAAAAFPAPGLSTRRCTTNHRLRCKGRTALPTVESLAKGRRPNDHWGACLNNAGSRSSSCSPHPKLGQPRAAATAMLQTSNDHRTRAASPSPPSSTLRQSSHSTQTWNRRGRVVQRKRDPPSVWPLRALPRASTDWPAPTRNCFVHSTTTSASTSPTRKIVPVDGWLNPTDLPPACTARLSCGA
jgi:hypothetical protein